MAGFTDSILEKKLSDLNNSQQSIQTLSLWLIHHRKHHKTIVHIWLHELRKAKPNRKLTFMYLANDIIQNSKKKGPEFSKEFSNVLSKAFSHVSHVVSDEKTKNGLERIINVWEERNIYDKTTIDSLRDSIHGRKAKRSSIDADMEKFEKKEKPEKKSKSSDKLFSETDHVVKKRKPHPKEESEVKEKHAPSPVLDPPEPDDLIKVLQDLENSPSTDAEVRERIASLPPQVSDISLLENVTGRDSGEKLSKQVEEACSLLTEYNNRLAEELDTRKIVFKMITDFLNHQKERVFSSEQKLGEYRERLKRVNQVKNELKSHLQNLPDLTLLPSVTGGLAPLPSAGDLFN